jgi:hypothetical protein
MHGAILPPVNINYVVLSHIQAQSILFIMYLYRLYLILISLIHSHCHKPFIMLVSHVTGEVN